MRIEYHRTLIADKVRNAAFHKALSQLIIPGKSIVADIGAGTGLLGLMASKLGAKQVYLYETAAVAGVAAQILKANKAKNCQLFACHSTEFQDPPKADIVVSETLGNYALEENIIATLADARARHLAPGGSLLPNRIEQFVAPVVKSRLHEELNVWDSAGAGLNLEIAKVMSFNNVYVRQIKVGELLDGGSSATVWDKIDLMKDARSTRKGEASWTASHPATIYGFAYWWSAHLTPGVALSTAPDAPATHWEQLYFPLLNPIEVSKNQSVSVALRSASSEEAGTHLSWSAVHKDAKGRILDRQAHDLDKGYLP